MAGVTLVLFISLIGLVGLAAHFLFFQGRRDVRATLELFLLRIISGIATISIILLIASLCGLLSKAFLLTSFGALFLAFAIQWKRQKRQIYLIPYLLFCICVGLASWGVGKITKPYEAILSANDATIYIGSAFQFADSGGYRYKDSLVLQMTPAERELFFSTEEEIYSRFLGGIKLSDTQTGLVTTGFLPLFPAWLALGILFLGSHGFLLLLSFFTVLESIILYEIGEKISGKLLGICLPIVLFFFFPQFYFSRLPLSEFFAQTLFLCSLFAFSRASCGNSQCLAGILWGSVFLCRIEMLLFSFLSFILLFCVHPEYKWKWREWRVFIVTVGAFALLTFYWLLATGIYLAPWGLREQTVAKKAWIPFVVFLRDLLNTHYSAGSAGILAISVILLILLNFILKKPIEKRTAKLFHIAGILCATFVFLSLVGTHLALHRILTHAYSATIYIPVVLLCVLLSGYFFLLINRIRGQNSSLILLLLILLIPPTIFFLTRPLIVSQQPLFSRRFVPVVIPLFFLLALTGWFNFLQVLMRPLLAKVAFVLLAACFVLTFYSDTLYLVRQPLFENVIGQVEKLAVDIPQDALVVIPRNQSGIHMELPLQYMWRRDTILVPEEGFQNLFHSFLQRQLEQDRPVFLLSAKRPDLDASVVPGFLLELEFKKNLIFRTLPPQEADTVPQASRSSVLRYRGYRLKQDASMQGNPQPESNSTIRSETRK